MSTDEPRPGRPQFGEYATPEEQQARIRQPDATFALENGISPQATDGDVPGRPAGTFPPAAPVSSPGAPAAPVRSGGRLANRIVTFGLLGYGLFNVLMSLPSYLDYPRFVDMFLSYLGAQGSLADPSGAQGYGTAAAIILAGGWILTTYLSVRVLRRGRLSWWIPLVGAVVFHGVSAVLLVVPLMQDPGLWNAIQGVLS